MSKGSQVEKFMVTAPKRQIALTKTLDEIYRALKTVPEECVRSPNWLELTQLRKMTFFKKCTKSAKTHKSLLSLLWNGKPH